LTVVQNVALNKGTRGQNLPEHCLNCMTFDKLILRKIIKIVAIRCRGILKLKRTRPRWGAYSAPQPHWLDL